MARTYLLPILSFAGLICIWELACRLLEIPSWMLPAPSRVIVASWEWRDALPMHIGVTLGQVLSGFLLAVGVGVPLSVLIVYSPLARALAYPMLLVLQSVPKVALAPLILLWAGYGIESKIVISAVTAFFPIVVNTTAGMSAVPAELLELTRSYRSPTLKVFWKVRLPWSLPFVFSGMKVAMTLAVIGSVVGEFVGSDRGLGFVILTASSSVNTGLVFGAMALLSIMGIFLFYVIVLAEKIACRWYSNADTSGGGAL